MHCKHCGGIIESDAHICRQPGEKVFTMAYNFQLPTDIDLKNTSVELTSLPLSDNPPADLTIQDILNSGGSAKGLVREIKSIINTWKKFIKKPGKENIILLIMGGLAFILWAWSKYLPGAWSFGYVAPDGLQGVIAVLMGTFTNVPSRILYYSAIITLMTAYIPGLFSGNTQKILGNAKSTYTLVRKIISYGRCKETYLALISLGFGLFFSNYMMRNNSFNKYIPCLVLGLTTLLASTGMHKSTFIRLMKGLYNDVSRLLKMDKQAVRYRLMVQIGFGSGLILSCLSSFLRGIRSTGFTDSFGYYAGTAIILAGVVMLMTGKPSTERTGSSS